MDRSIEDPGIFLKTNIWGTSTLMDSCLRFGIKRYHQVSTDEVYGDLPLDRPDLFLQKKLRCILVLHIVAARLALIYLYWLIIVLMAYK